MPASLHRAWVRINRATRGVPQRLVSDALLVVGVARLAGRELGRRARGGVARPVPRPGLAENPWRAR